MCITNKGQVTTPQDIREKAHLLPGSEVDFEYRRGEVVLKVRVTDHRDHLFRDRDHSFRHGDQGPFRDRDQ
jgi:AbrB family looped-hinge helix DNA binding protein